MFQVNPIIYGIGNPLIDIVINATDADLLSLGLQKGIMYLVDENRQSDILHYFKETTPEYHPGGSAPNTILACSGLGTPSLIAGKIGNDSFGDIYLSRTKEYGVSSGLIQVDGSTGSSIVLVTPDGERTMNTHLGICREFSDNDIDEAKPTLFSLKAVLIINIAIVSVDLPGPPPVKAKTLSYNLKVEIRITTVLIVSAGANNGQSKYLNFCNEFAPSI